MTPDLIPPMAIIVPFLYDGWMWLQFKKRNMTVARRWYAVFAVCFFLQGILFITFALFDLPVDVRGFWVRLSLVNIGVSFAVPLTFQYMQTTNA